MSVESELELHRRVFRNVEQPERPPIVLDHGIAHRRLARRMARASRYLPTRPASVFRHFDASRITATFNGQVLSGFTDGTMIEVESAESVRDAVTPSRTWHVTLTSETVVPRPSPRVPAWLVLAKLVDHAREHGGEVNARGAYYLSHQYDTDTAPARLSTGTDDEEFAYAERMMLLWSERALELQGRGAKKPELDLSTGCRTCGADPGALCQPTHDGEREPGAWSHPIRTMDLATGEDLDRGAARRGAASRAAST